MKTAYGIKDSDADATDTNADTTQQNKKAKYGQIMDFVGIIVSKTFDDNIYYAYCICVNRDIGFRTTIQMTEEELAELQKNSQMGQNTFFYMPFLNPALLTYNKMEEERKLFTVVNHHTLFTERHSNLLVRHKEVYHNNSNICFQKS
jgi:hypothetical protein